MIDKDAYFTDYESYTENEIAEISAKGIALRNGGSIDFAECSETFRIIRSIEGSKCVGERDISDFSFTFYTCPKPTMIKFIEKNAFIEFFSKRNARQRFYELQKIIIEFGYKTYDET